jgi:hypothetical protein
MHDDHCEFANRDHIALGKAPGSIVYGMAMRLSDRTPFTWITAHGDAVPITEMSTTHLFFTLRLIYNFVAPPQHRMPGRVCTSMIVPRQYLVKAVQAMIPELKSRADLTASHEIILKEMVLRARRFAF